MSDLASGQSIPHVHPPYMRVFFWLAGLTLVEILVPIGLGQETPRLSVTILVLIAIWKILLIIRYFMHLKFDAKLLTIVASVPFLLASIMVVGLLLDFLW